MKISKKDPAIYRATKQIIINDKKRRPKRSCKESNPKSVTLKGDAANPLPRYSEKPGRNPEKIISKQNEKPTFWPLIYFF